MARAACRTACTAGPRSIPSTATVHLGAGRGARLKIAGAWREGLLHRILASDALGRAGGLLAVPAIRDQQLKASLVVDDDEEIQALVLASRDDLQRQAASVDPEGARVEALDRRFTRAALRYLKRPVEGESAEAVVWVGSESSGRSLRSGSVPARLRTETRSIGLHARLRERLASRAALILGLDGLVARSRVQRAGSLTVPAREGDAAVFGQPPGDDVNADDWRSTAVTAAPFASAELDLGRLQGSAGVRLESLGLEVSRVTPRVGATPAVGHRRLDWSADPRASLTWEIRPGTRLMASGGRYHQLPPPEDLSAVFGTPRLGPSRADHVALGARTGAGESFTAEITAFAKRLANLPVRDPSATPPLARVLTGQGRGHGVGVQALVRCFDARGFSGWLAYTLSRSERRDQPGSVTCPADFDQPHVLAAVASYRRRSWTFGSRGRWATGAPRTPVVGSVYDGRTDRHAPLFGPLNSTRLPWFFQIDLRGERTFTSGRASLDVYLALLNVTARNNAEELAYNFDYSDSQSITGLPLLAVAGARLRF